MGVFFHPASFPSWLYEIHCWPKQWSVDWYGIERMVTFSGPMNEGQHVTRRGHLGNCVMPVCRKRLAVRWWFSPVLVEACLLDILSPNGPPLRKADPYRGVLSFIHRSWVTYITSRFPLFNFLYVWYCCCQGVLVSFFNSFIVVFCHRVIVIMGPCRSGKLEIVMCEQFLCLCSPCLWSNKLKYEQNPVCDLDTVLSAL